MPQLRAAFEVRAGLIPDQAMPEYTKQFFYTSEDREDDAKLPPMPEGHTIDMNGSLDQPHMSIFTRRHIEAMRYYSELVDPTRINWVSLTWIWF